MHVQWQYERFGVMRSSVQRAFDEGARVQVTAFISSTFADTTAERNFFMQFAYPELNRFCQSLGLTFNTVDLRWGVRNESTDDHMTIDICLGELQRCMSSSTAASFVFFAGERYPTTLEHEPDDRGVVWRLVKPLILMRSCTGMDGGRCRTVWRRPSSRRSWV